MDDMCFKDSEMIKPKYKTFEAFLEAVQSGLHPDYVFEVDNDCCYAWEPDPDDEDESIELFAFSGDARKLLINHIAPMIGLRARRP